MKFKPLVPIIWTNDIKETVDFYTQNLGFICEESNDDWDLAILIKDEAEIMITRPNKHVDFEKPIFTGSFYIKTDEVDALWNRIKIELK